MLTIKGTSRGMEGCWRVWPSIPAGGMGDVMSERIKKQRARQSQPAGRAPGRTPGLEDSPRALFQSPKGLEHPSPEGDGNKAPGESSSPGMEAAQRLRH